MMNNKYKEMLSQYSVPEELLRTTAKKMDDALVKKEKENTSRIRTFRPRTAAIAAALLLVASTTVYFSRLAMLDPAPAESIGNDVVSQQEEPGESLSLGEQGDHDASKDDAAGSRNEITEPVSSETSGKVSDIKTNAHGTPIKLINEFYGVGGTNYERRVAHSVDEILEKENPLGKFSVDTLPVFLNSVSEYGTISLSEALTFEDMEKIARKIAADLGVQVLATAQNSDMDPQNKEVYSLDYSVDCEQGIRIWVQMDGRTMIRYMDTEQIASYETAQEALDSLYPLLRSVMGMENPVQFMYADFNADGSCAKKYFFFDDFGSPWEEIYSYNFYPVSVKLDEKEGYRVRELNFRSVYLGCSLGEMPIISEEEARARLYEENYLTTIPYDTPVNEETVKAVELVYWTNSSLEYHQPMYRFWVELERQPGEVLPEDLHTYGAYYVPAVSEEYLDNSALTQPY